MIKVIIIYIKELKSYLLKFYYLVSQKDYLEKESILKLTLKV